MAKITSWMNGSGKQGDVVLSRVGGQVITRQYNPNPANPSTPKQVAQRAKMKLITQLAASLAPAIAIRREGLKSARNLFVKENFGAMVYEDDHASIALGQVKITKSSLGFPDFTASRTGTTGINVQLKTSAANSVNRVVYAAFLKANDGSLTAFDSIVVNEAGANGLFAGTLTYTSNSIVIYAYGVRDNSAGVSTIFGNLNAPSAEVVAQLLTNSSEVAGNTSVTITKGLTMNTGVNSGDSATSSSESPSPVPTIPGGDDDGD